MRVRVGSLYVFQANGWDRFDPLTNLTDGTVVRVGNLHGAPPANTMGQCYVFHPDTGKFIGMVSTGSLSPAPKKRK